MNPKELRTPLLAQFEDISLFTEIAFLQRDNSRVQKTVNKACRAEAKVIGKIAAEGSLSEKIALEYQLQRRDLEKYAKSPEAEKNIKQGLKDLEAGLVSYADLLERPQEYQRQALQYTDRNRDNRLDVPKDGMRYAVASQMTRLQNRQSLQLSDEEKQLLIARRSLVSSIRDEYSRLQEKVVHNRTDDGIRNRR